MHYPFCGHTGRIWLLMALLTLCGIASAADHLRLAMAEPATMTSATARLQLALAEPPTPTWRAADPAAGRLLAGPTTPWIHVRVDRGDTLSGLFDDVGLGASQWHAVLALDDTVDPLRHLNPGDEFRLRKTPGGRLATLHYPLGPTQTLVVYRGEDGLTAQIERVDAIDRRLLVNGVVGSSLPRSLRRAGVPARIANALAQLFAGRTNLSRSISPGDRFAIIYAAAFVDGDRVGVGPIIAASIHTDGHVYRAFRHVNANGEAHYYDSRGRPLKPAIERTPLNYSHVSSPFDLDRVHPVLGVVRPHTGVDLAAPRGTPVHAGADGTVTFVGWLSGYGRIVKIDHGMGYATRYAHLAGFADGLDEGDHVAQGQTIGYVGQSGITTAYHLHYEILRNGEPHDPLSMQLPSTEPLSGAVLTAFTSHIQPLIARLSGNGSAQTLIAANTGFGPSFGNNPGPDFDTGCSSAGAVSSLLALAPGQVESEALGRIFCAIGG